MQRSISNIKTDQHNESLFISLHIPCTLIDYWFCSELLLRKLERNFTFSMWYSILSSSVLIGQSRSFVISEFMYIFRSSVIKSTSCSTYRKWNRYRLVIPMLQKGDGRTNITVWLPWNQEHHIHHYYYLQPKLSKFHHLDLEISQSHLHYCK